MKIELLPIGFVRGGRAETIDDDWGEVEADVELDAGRFGPQALQGLGSFSHVVVVYHFHRVDPAKVESGARRPRGNPAWPPVGIFAQRGKARPNRIGVSVCQVRGVSGRTLRVRGLDAVDGTPVLDLKPCMSGFEPRGQVREPQWAREIMARYW